MPAKENLIGKKFNFLTVVEEVPKNQRKNSKRVEWLCQCDCGNQTRVITNYLKSGHTKSCGCWREQNASLLFSTDLVGQKFNRLLVVEKTGQRGSDGSIIWKCKCDCGNTHFVSTNSLKTGTIASCGCLRSKGESLISNLLENNSINFQRQYHFNDLTGMDNKHYLYFDFAIFDNQNNLLCLIEYQGEQHYSDVTRGTWISPINNDVKKKEYCQKNNIVLIEIPYWDYDKINWQYLKDKIF